MPMNIAGENGIALLYISKQLTVTAKSFWVPYL